MENQNPNQNQNAGFNNNEQQFNQQQQQPQYNQQQQQNQQQANNNFQHPSSGVFQTKVPNSVGVLTLGILSILSMCCCGPFLGPILALIALLLVSKGKQAYAANPQNYKVSSFKNLKAGQIIAIIALVLCISWLIFAVIMYMVNPGEFNQNYYMEIIEGIEREIR